MKNNKNTYTAPSLEILKTECEDVISTSGFPSEDYSVGTEDHNESGFEL